MNRIILDHVATTNLAIEKEVYAQYQDVNVVELVQENFSLYGHLVVLNALKNTRTLFDYKKKVFRYYCEVN